MWKSIIFNIILSVIIITILHQLWNYLKDTFSIRKTKDLVGSQIKKYKDIIDEMEMNKKTTVDSLEIVSKLNVENLIENGNIDFSDMKNDLEQFMDTII